MNDILFLFDVSYYDDSEEEDFDDKQPLGKPPSDTLLLDSTDPDDPTLSNEEMVNNTQYPGNTDNECMALSKDQLLIFAMKHNTKLPEKTINTILCRICRGYRREKGMKGGRNLILSDAEAIELS